MNEADTRAQLVDPALKDAGWGGVEGSRVLREYRITQGRLQGAGQRGKPEIADYVLEYRNEKLAIVEAKRRDLSASEGVMQAKQYASKMMIRFTYATNGTSIYGIDLQTGSEGEIDRFPSPETLWNMAHASENAWRDRFADIPFESVGGSFQPRYYQETAIQRVTQAISEGQKRILLTLATGTGKTFIAFQIAWKLFQARWNLSREPSRRPRILFLADRNILADQAFNAFHAFPEDALVRIDPEDIRKKGQVPTNGSLFFTIFQTFMSGQGESPYFGDYPPDFFDFIVIDECHRGGAKDESNWRGILDYFSPAVQLGLTATPKRRDNVDTYAYFGEPVYIYSLKDGINDGFLTPFKVKQFATTLDEYIYTPDDDLLEGEIQRGKTYLEKDFNRKIVIPERERYRVKLFMSLIDQREKTLVFCANQEHAALVRDIINQETTSTDPLYCVRVTSNDGPLGDQYLKTFQDNEKTIPTILTTSQKLNTGVDARNIRNIVLLRTVGSIIEFKQIIGRGTRLYDGKDFFTIYDFVKAHHHFGDPEWDGEPLEPEGGSQGGGGAREPRLPLPPTERPVKIRIKLRDGKERTIQSISSTIYFGPDGNPVTAAQFLEGLFGTLPEFFKDEDALRTIWSDPETRKAFLQGLAEKGYHRELLADMQQIIDAQNSDLYDVLAYVAFALQPVPRCERAEHAKLTMDRQLTDKQRAFLEFVLAQYVKVGDAELDTEKLSPLLKLKYNNAISDAFAELGSPAQVRELFRGFQRYLYTPTEQVMRR